jgi:prepilin-type N-terminal cleavage/methylation domain-containing protein
MLNKNTGGCGFTLVELMFVVNVTAILASIADITTIQVCIGCFRSNNFNYLQDLASINSCLPNKGLDSLGNAYVYFNIINAGSGIRNTARLDKLFRPINTLHELYSIGKYGLTSKKLTIKTESMASLARDGFFAGFSYGL